MKKLAPFAFSLLAACGTPPPSAPPSSAPSPPPPASAPCATDADCRLYDGPACSCWVALTSASVTPSMTPCFAPPCMNREAYCDVARSTCAIRAATVPPPPSSAPPASELPADPPGLGDVAPIS